MLYFIMLSVDFFVENCLCKYYETFFLRAIQEDSLSEWFSWFLWVRGKIMEEGQKEDKISTFSGS